MYKVLILIALLLLIVGCHPTYEFPPVVEAPVTRTDVKAEEQDTIFGIRIGKVFINEFYPGARADTYTSNDPEGYYKKGDPIGVIVINNWSQPAQFLLTPVKPNSLYDGFVAAPDYVLKDWVFISDDTPTLAAKEAKLIPIALWMPEDAEVFADKWEFRILVRDLSQTGFVRTALESRWFVEMMD